MAYTALQLITRAFYLSQVVARELEVVSQSKITDGLYLLNAALDFKGSDLRLIPYFQPATFTTVQGQEMYTIPNLLQVQSLTYNIGPVRYAMQPLTREDYFATFRVDGVQSLPFSYRLERELDNMNLYFYPFPADAYIMNFRGKFGLTEVTLTTDLSLVYDLYYIEYLRYELAKIICDEWGATFPDGAMKRYMELQKKIMDVSPYDLSIRKSSYYVSNHQGVDWQLMNLWKGWWP